MTTMLPLAALTAAMMVSGCVRPSQRIAVELQKQGFDPASARCIGDRMDERLTVSQLLRLRGALQRYRDTVDSRPTVDFAALMTMAQEIGDPQIVLETVGAGLTCGMHR
ncbi:MAG: hypothetical protein EOO77_09910 [Oxalobacteraceae bacterium]|nr:MAG: hypothetical protein EOO77_09910 [Oxalobacteraceae bacterium]